MTDDPGSGEQEKEEDGEGEAQGSDGQKAVDPNLPPYGLSDHGLGTQWSIVADDEVKETFGSKTLANLNDGSARWAAKFSGEGLDGPSADPLKVSSLLRRIALTARWFGNGLFPGNRKLPGVVMVATGHSIVLEFSTARDEEPVTIPAERLVTGDDDEQEEVAAKSLYPTVEGGRFLASVLDSAEEPEELVSRLQHVGKQAVGMYQGTLKEIVEFGAEMDLIVPALGHEGESVRRRVNFPVERGQKELVVLDRIPEEVSDTLVVEGLLYMQNSLNSDFGIALDRGKHLTGEYDIRVADKLGSAWNKRVEARIEEIGPKESWMPRAGRTRRVLQDVKVLEDKKAP